MTAKRDTTSTCPHCGESFKQDGIGRTRLFCSDACKTAAHRAAKRQHRATHYAEVSAHYLAGEIGTYEGSGDYAGADALRRLAAHHRLTLDEARIAAKCAEAGSNVFALRDAGGWSSLTMPNHYVAAGTIANEGVVLR